MKTYNIRKNASGEWEVLHYGTPEVTVIATTHGEGVVGEYWAYVIMNALNDRDAKMTRRNIES